MLKPSEDRIFVRLAKSADMIGTIHVPDTAKKPPVSGEVIAVGPGISCKHCGLPKEPTIKEGWIVVFPDGAGYDFMVGDEPLRVIRWSDIQGYDDLKK